MLGLSRHTSIVAQILLDTVSVSGENDGVIYAALALMSEGRTTTMKDSSGSRSFGVLVAYVLPGFLALLGLTPVFPTVARWLQPIGQGDWELGPPLYAILAATMIGMVLSCFRWVLLEPLHGILGLRRPQWDDRKLDRVLEGFDYLVLNHYRYYEFCSNTLLAAAGGYLMNRAAGTAAWLGWMTDIVIATVCGVLFAASHNALKNYYARTGSLVGISISRTSGDAIMYNGNDHGGTTTGTPDKNVNKKHHDPKSNSVSKATPGSPALPNVIPARDSEGPNAK